MTSVASPQPQDLAPVRRDTRGVRSFRVITLLIAIAAWIALVNAGDDVRVVLTPALVILTIAMLFVSVLYGRDRRLPVFEVGTLFVAAVTVYSVFPLVQYCVMGMEFTPFSDLRMYTYQPTPREWGGFAWRHVTLIATYSAVYLLFRGRGEMAPVSKPAPVTVAAVVIALVAVTAYFVALRLYTGPMVTAYEGGTNAEYLSLPRPILQLNNIFLTARLVLKQLLVIALMTRWKHRLARFALFGWIAYEIVATVMRGGARAQTALLVLTVILVYHRVVRPLRPALAFAAGSFLLVGFIGLGLLRDVHTQADTRRTMYSINNEFQGLFANAYDLHVRKTQKILPPVPPQMYFSDLYALIPSQLLPFHKADPSNWYIGVLGLKGSGMGFMFGFLAQTTIGFDWAEIIVRAMLLALLHVFFHRFYRRNSSSFWVTMFYLFTITWAYYAFRSTSFDILYKLIYYFLPTFIAVTVIRVLLTTPVKAARKVLRS